MKLSLESFNFNVIFIILIVFKSLEEMKTNWKETGSLKKYLDSFVKSLILAFRDFFKSKFCGILVHIMSTFCSSKSNNENKCVLRNLFRSPKQRSFIWDILRSLISYDQVNSLSYNIVKVKALRFCACVGRKQNARMKGKDVTDSRRSAIHGNIQSSVKQNFSSSPHEAQYLPSQVPHLCFYFQKSKTSTYFA